MGLNLHSIVAPLIGAINPIVNLSIRVSTGYATSPSGKQVPSYANAVIVPGQVQPLSSGDIKHLDALNIQGVRRAIYINGQVNGLIRSENKGGDLITTPDNRIWLVVAADESWEYVGWCKVLVTLQNNA